MGDTNTVTNDSRLTITEFQCQTGEGPKRNIEVFTRTYLQSLRKRPEMRKKMYEGYQTNFFTLTPAILAL